MKEDKKKQENVEELDKYGDFLEAASDMLKPLMQAVFEKDLKKNIGDEVLRMLDDLREETRVRTLEPFEIKSIPEIKAFVELQSSPNEKYNLALVTINDMILIGKSYKSFDLELTEAKLSKEQSNAIKNFKETDSKFEHWLRTIFHLKSNDDLIYSITTIIIGHFPNQIELFFLREILELVKIDRMFVVTDKETFENSDISPFYVIAEDKQMNIFFVLN